MQHYLRLLLIGLFIAVTSNLPAQSVGINTTIPHFTSILDIQSTTKGVLIPRMTSTERLAITGAATGLMVFDNTTNSFWVKKPSSWQQMMDFANAHWSDNGTGVLQLVSATRVSISPNSISNQSRLTIEAETTSPNTPTPFIQLYRSTTGTAAPGLAGSIDFLMEQNNGSFQTTSRIICESLNNTPGDQTASLEFFTTNSGVTNSQLYLGPVSVGIGTSTPAFFSKLDVNGSINASGKFIRASVTGASNLVPLCYGAVDAAGDITSGTGNFSVLKTSTGVYLVSNGSFDDNCIVIITPRAVNVGSMSPRMTTTAFDSGAGIYVRLYNGTGSPVDHGFHFMIYKQ